MTEPGRIEVTATIDVAALAAELSTHRPAAAAPAALPVEAGRLALSKAEAAEALGISVDHLERWVMPEVRVVRSGRLRLIAVAELERWLDENATRMGEWR